MAWMRSAFLKHFLQHIYAASNLVVSYLLKSSLTEATANDVSGNRDIYTGVPSVFPYFPFITFFPSDLAILPFLILPHN